MIQLPESKLDFTTETFGKDEIAEMEIYNKFEKAKLQEQYNRVAANYEAIYQRAGYQDPEKCAKLVDEITQREEMSRGDVEILDFGCGTGFVGQCLNDLGYRNISGLDISENMLELAA